MIQDSEFRQDDTNLFTQLGSLDESVAALVPCDTETIETMGEI